MFFNFRAAWYAVLVCVFAFFTSGIIIAPWYYVVMPLLVLLVTIYYFDCQMFRSIKKGDRDMIVRYGLGGAIFWFFVAGIFSLLEIAGFYYFDMAFYFSDIRNVFLFPLVLLVPMLYGIVLSNMKLKKPKRGRWAAKKVI